MNYDIKACGKRISQLRAKNGLTQEQVAGVLNIDRSFFSRIEAGKSGCSIDLFIQLAELFGVSLDYVILGRHSADLFSDEEKLLIKKDIENLIRHLEQVKKLFC